MYQNRGRQQDKLIENFEIKISFAGHTTPEKRENTCAEKKCVIRPRHTARKARD
jgi:hypothetical protein